MSAVVAINLFCTEGKSNHSGQKENSSRELCFLGSGQQDCYGTFTAIAPFMAVAAMGQVLG